MVESKNFEERNKEMHKPYLKKINFLLQRSVACVGQMVKDSHPIPVTSAHSSTAKHKDHTLECAVCGKQFPRGHLDLIRHMNAITLQHLFVKGETKESAGGFNFHCARCGISFNCHDHLDSHNSQTTCGKSKGNKRIKSFFEDLELGTPKPMSRHETSLQINIRKSIQAASSAPASSSASSSSSAPFTIMPVIADAVLQAISPHKTPDISSSSIDEAASSNGRRLRSSRKEHSNSTVEENSPSAMLALEAKEEDEEDQQAHKRPRLGSRPSSPSPLPLNDLQFTFVNDEEQYTLGKSISSDKERVTVIPMSGVTVDNTKEEDTSGAENVDEETNTVVVVSDSDDILSLSHLVEPLPSSGRISDVLEVSSPFQSQPSSASKENRECSTNDTQSNTILSTSSNPVRAKKLPSFFVECVPKSTRYIIPEG
jgi:hypothetical protein